MAGLLAVRAADARRRRGGAGAWCSAGRAGSASTAGSAARRVRRAGWRSTASISVLGAYSLPETSNPFAMNSGAGIAKSLLTLLSMVASAVGGGADGGGRRRCSATPGSGWPCRSALAYGVGAALLGRVPGRGRAGPPDAGAAGRRHPAPLMPVVEAVVTVPVPPELAFAVSQTVAPVRYRWDPFVREQHFVDGATRPGRGVRTFTRSRHGLTMVSEYVSFAPPTNVGMKMVRGPWFFELFAGGWRFAPGPQPGTTVATWRYNFRCRPAFLRPVADGSASGCSAGTSAAGSPATRPAAPTREVLAAARAAPARTAAGAARRGLAQARSPTSYCAPAADRRPTRCGAWRRRRGGPRPR